MRPTAVLATAIAVLFVLTACEPPAPAPTPAGSPTESSTPSPTPTPTPTPEPLAISDCETMLPIDLARSLFSENTEFFGEDPIIEIGAWFRLAEAGDLFVGAAQSHFCRWAVPNSDGSFYLVAAEVPAAQQAVLADALLAGGFASSETDGVRMFQLEWEGGLSTESETHLFVGDVWVVSGHSNLVVTGPVAQSALNAIRAANPTLDL